MGVSSGAIPAEHLSLGPVNFTVPGSAGAYHLAFHSFKPPRHHVSAAALLVDHIDLFLWWKGKRTAPGRPLVIGPS